ncbi:unnamed protein product [Mycena citricolor]|uniref:Uncharacterized protein n=1 Tax=Mycena citricolor TaxID=2018698 RepID=A0AAD2HH68_9AGAR|nr:unnamed protein product [Mycena citricolor]CAK5274789.1 unnamed protein product [Mycena citricolor]
MKCQAGDYRRFRMLVSAHTITMFKSVHSDKYWPR